MLESVCIQHRLCLLLSMLFCCTQGYAGEVVEIPLSEIWALDMPGTKDIHGLGFGEPWPRQTVGWGPVEYQQSRESGINAMILALSAKLPSEQAVKGFIMPFEPSVPMLKRLGENIRSARKHELFDGGDKEYQRGKKLTLIFFSHPSSYYMHVKEVKRHGHEIIVGYQQVPHYTVESTVHFALIPLDDLPTGEYQVKFEPLRMEQKFHDAGFIRLYHPQQNRFVCNNFNFKIWDPVEPDRTEASKDAIEIPLSSIWGFNMNGTKDMKEIDSPYQDSQRTLANEISVSLHTSKVGQKAGKGIAVKGTGKEALVSIDKIIKKRIQASYAFSPDDEINLYLFTRSASAGARLDQIVRDGNQIRIEYHFGTRNDVGTDFRYVVVPLGKLEKGRYSVEMVMRPRQPGPLNKYGIISPDHLV